MKFLNRFFLIWLVFLTVIISWYILKYRPQFSSISLPSPPPILTPTPTPTPTIPINLYPVTKIIDGDTIDVLVDNKTQKIRLIGIDAPEISKTSQNSCYGQESSNELKNLLTGKNVRLQADNSQTDMDKYGRYLRYVYLEDGTFLNQHMIRSGFAREYTYDKPYQFQQVFIKDQINAQNNKLGLWSVCP